MVKFKVDLLQVFFCCWPITLRVKLPSKMAAENLFQLNHARYASCHILSIVLIITVQRKDFVGYKFCGLQA